MTTPGRRHHRFLIGQVSLADNLYKQVVAFPKIPRDSLHRQRKL
jgi:hypothetical protein